MIKSGKDLRIGNLILVDGKIVEVENVSEYGINGQSWSDTHYGTQSGGFDYEYEFSKNKIEGITLTEELLIKAGFLYCTTSYQWSNSTNINTPDLIVVNIECYPNKKGYWYDNLEIKYVHQLQNLYFCLTGEELTFNLNRDEI